MTYEILKTTTWGITQDPKFENRFKVPLVIRDQDILRNIANIVQHNYPAKDPLYGNNPDYKTLYLSIPKWLLSEQDKVQLVDQGKQEIRIDFRLDTIYKSNTTNLNYINFKVTKLAKA